MTAGEIAADPHDRFEHPLVARYASDEMVRLFAARTRVETWRRLWVALAEAQAELGIGGVTAEQAAALKEAAGRIDFARAEALEQELRHDVMAHLHAFAEAAPVARPILHLGATSASIVDNADLILQREALRAIERKALCVVQALADFAAEHADRPTLAWTHFQPAQPTTVGKRACLWIADLLLDLDEIGYRLETFRLRGLKGTTGTQASFLALTGGDPERTDELERRFLSKLGAHRSFPVTGQTYSRKVDAAWAATLAGVAQSAGKFSQDLRLLQHLGELREPFGARQVGSSAMAYKRNPMRAERMSGLSRLVIQTAGNLMYTAATQWLERSLDDSAVKRIAMPELFLGVDALLVLYHGIATGLEVETGTIDRRLRAELPALASEDLLMAAVESGGDRQALHERIRVRAREAAARVATGEGNDLLDRLAGEEGFAGIPSALWERARDPAAYVGRAPEQTRRFLADHVHPRLAMRKGSLEMTGDVRV
ncbi:MAG TPA: adenylosuccinate lyase [Gemmatimonadota bacterium]|nr:adenylosuccinate lyase [Gemmatimonadota bacterium]